MGEGGWTQVELGEGRTEWQEVRTHKEQHRRQGRTGDKDEDNLTAPGNQISSQTFNHVG